MGHGISSDRDRSRMRGCCEWLASWQAGGDVVVVGGGWQEAARRVVVVVAVMVMVVVRCGDGSRQGRRWRVG